VSESVQPEYAEQVLTYEESGYEAAAAGDYGKAIEVWTAIISSHDMRPVFEANPDALKELAWNLAIAHLGAGQVAEGEALVSQYGLDAGAFAEAVAATGGDESSETESTE
jgi:hypothetical protein